jgi:hypothetical protein
MPASPFDEQEPSSYFGLYSANQRTQVVELLSRLRVRFTFDVVQESEERLRAWAAWDESSANTHTGHELFIRSEDLDILGTQLVELFPERKFGAE